MGLKNLVKLRKVRLLPKFTEITLKGYLNFGKKGGPKSFLFGLGTKLFHKGNHRPKIIRFTFRIGKKTGETRFGPKTFN